MSPTKEEVQKFCLVNNIDVEFHDKRISKGCRDAITARSESLKKPLTLDQELKTLLLRTKKGELIAIHMPGDRKVLSGGYVQMGDHCRSFREFHDFDAASKILGIKITGMAFATSGTLNPISLHMEYRDRIKQFFDVSLDTSKAYYTNAGDKKHGMQIIDLKQVMAVMPHKICDVSEPLSRRRSSSEMLI